MVESVPKRIDESGAEDIQDVQEDISALAAKYIVPIDQIRSIMQPGPTGDGFEGQTPSNSRRVESRAHAFMRFVGFPVVAGGESKEFYNPGFDPFGGVFIGTLTGRRAIKENVTNKFNKNSVLKGMIAKREQDPKDLRSIFIRRDAASSVYALMLRHVRNFKMLKAKGPFEIDLQTSKNDIRFIELQRFFAENENIDEAAVTSVFTNTNPIITENLTGVRHILHPFVVDPRIDNTVMPEESQIAVPFLQDKESLKFDAGVFILRPGIELIIRERLRDHSNEAEIFFENVEKLINNDQSPLPDVMVRTENELRLTVEALLDKNDISESAILSIKEITGVQIKNIQTLVKTIRKVVSSLKKSGDKIDEATQEINWVPLPNSEGPELGALGAILNQKDTANSPEIDNKVLELKIKIFNAERRIAEEKDLGNFASPFNISVNDDDINKINSELQDKIAERDKIADGAFKAMGDIEIISGEVSGLGLLDVLAIYVTLWAMDEKALISMLDDQSFSRLKNFNEDLLVGAAAARAADSTDKLDIEQALEKFETKLVNVLTFIDREIERQGVAPGEEVTGDVSADS